MEKFEVRGRIARCEQESWNMVLLVESPYGQLGCADDELRLRGIARAAGSVTRVET